MYRKRSFIKFIVSGSFVLILVGYSFTNARSLILGPELNLIEPIVGSETASDLVKIRGYAENASHLFLNDRQIFTDENGYFEETLLLVYGYNVFEIRASDRFGTEKEELLQLIYR